MIIQKHGYILDVDIEDTLQYSREHSLCDCDEDRNLYTQIREKFPELTAFLAELGLLIERPDETGSCAVDDYIEYHFISYTVIGNILESDKYEIDMFDGGIPLNIVIDNLYVPNEQETDRYFTVTVTVLICRGYWMNHFPKMLYRAREFLCLRESRNYFPEISILRAFLTCIGVQLYCSFA